ncbi:MAG: PKD domain-containing protein, partial [Nanoarchaeota archaeon]
NINVNTYPKPGKNLAEDIQDYILSKYKSLDCSGGCNIPVRFTSKINQNINLSNLILNYNSNLGAVSENKFYDSSETPSLVSSNFQKIYLNPGNFSVLSSYGNVTYGFNLKGSHVFSEEITITTVPVITALSPAETASIFPTKFEVLVSDGNIIQYTWDFGDNTSKIITSTNRVTHTYNKIGKYKLKITVTGSDQKVSSKFFNINVISSKNMIEPTFSKIEKNLNDLSLEIKNFDSFSQDNLKLILNLEDSTDKLKSLKREYLVAYSEEDYTKIAESLLKLNVPKSVKLTKMSNYISFHNNREIINLDSLTAVGGRYNSSDKEDYLDSILNWNQKNLNSQIKLEEYSAFYENGSEKIILDVFDMKLEEKASVGYSYYLFIKELKDINFKEDYSESRDLGYVFIEIKSKESNFVFSTTESIAILKLPLFLSPPLNKLTLSKNSIDDDSSSKKWIYFLLFFLVISIGIFSYFILRKWYKTRYETYLFKDRNNLYNLLIYIEGERRKKRTDKEIRDKLKRAGWNSEQITYAIKKHAGKKTGMI